MNPISKRIHTGAVGELLVQVRLLQHGVQAAPPIKDSGNDLIAVKGDVFQAVQVRTTASGKFTKPKQQRKYHILAVVMLLGEDHELWLDQSQVFLIPKANVPGLPTNCRHFREDYRITKEWVQQMFGE